MKILDVGSGPTPKLVSTYTEIEITYCDRDFGHDMEKLPYEDNSFDLVTCINALDHTRDAEAALEEMLRVGRSIYINCALYQLTRHRKHHYWDADPNGVLTNPSGKFDLKDYGFEITCEGGRMMAWYR